MKYYLISYDLRSPGRDYSALYDEIKSYMDYQHPMESTWVVHVPDSVKPTDLRIKLLSKMDQNDSIFVVDISESAYSGWLPSSFWKWYRQADK